MSHQVSSPVYLEEKDEVLLTKTLTDWSNTYPQGGVFALVAEKSANLVKLLQEQADRHTYPVAGAVFPALITAGELKNEGLLLIRYNTMPAYSINTVPADPALLDDAIEQIISVLNIQTDNPQQSLFMIFDGMLPNIASIIDSIYLQIGDSVNYMGVNAGSETFQPVKCLFDNNQFVDNGVLCLLVPEHDGAILEHGYTNPDASIAATSASNNCIKSIDWRPAFEIYQELANKYYNQVVTRENFYEIAVHFPLGIIRMDGEMLVRIPVALEEDGSIHCVGEVPENSILTLLEAISPDSTGTIDILTTKLEAQPAKTIVTFYCAGRRMHLGEAALDEIKQLSQRLQDKTMVGALSLGEIGGSKTGGYPLFHNAALVAIPWT